MEKGHREVAFLFLGFLRPSGACRGRAPLYRLLIVRRPYGTVNPVGVTDNKQAVSTPADNTDDTYRNPVGVTGKRKKPLQTGAAFRSRHREQLNSQP